MKKKVYISGPITGYNLHERRHTFNQAANLLRSQGHQPVNPFDNGLDPSCDYSDHMRADLRLLLDCDAILQLPDWQMSAGAQLEHEVAHACRLEILRLHVVNEETEEFQILTK
ncbi:MAG: DUF4406 domain-containing protein [Akkermansia sp.]